MNHFQSKSLIFYGVAIGLVLVLFKTATVYGENHLQAPPSLKNRYRLTWTKANPECEKSPPLTLNIQQSGIYVNALLAPTNTTVETEQPFKLTGILRNQQLHLAGKINQTICNNDSKTIEVQMQLGNQGNLQGQIIISNISQSLEFNATPEAVQVPSGNSNHH